jgi:heat shock protein HtpX
MSMNSWLARRAALAILLMVSFYALALSVSAGLLWLAYADVVHTRHTAWRLVAFCVAGAASVLWAIIPRPDRFEAPGPEITEQDHPELFGVIREVAAATSQPIPAEVYLLNDVNAFVAQRGGFMGHGSRRVMGLGLPLMEALTVDEFKGVLAHEFGHYHAGDVALGPWIHKTRSAIGRTLQHLDDNVLRYIFQGFGTLFLRVTHAVSRRQEFIADEVAARVVGGNAMSSGLRKVNAASFAYQNYWYAELTPVMQAGFCPPVTAGFGRYMERPALSHLFEALMQHEETQGKTDPFDTHPSLRDRVAALRAQPSMPAHDARPASLLLRDVEQWERRVLGALSAHFAALKPVDWSRVSDTVYRPLWRQRIEQHGSLLREFTIASPPAQRETLIRIGRSIVRANDAPDEACLGAAWQLIVAGFSLALEPHGWDADTSPGEEVTLRRGSDELRPWSELSELVNGSKTLEAWHMRVSLLGIGGIPLGEGAPAATNG